MNKLQQCAVMHEYLNIRDYEDILNLLGQESFEGAISVKNIYMYYQMALRQQVMFRYRKISREEYEEEFK